MRETHANQTWPVNWASAARLAISPATLPSDARLAPHRMLDRLAALAHAADGGATGGADAFREAVRDLTAAVPLPTRDPGPSGPAQADPYRRGLPTLIDHAGLNALNVAAARLAGRDGTSLVLGLTLAALAAEAGLQSAGYLADRALLGGGGGIATRSGAGTAAKCVKLLDNLMEFEEYNFPLPVPDGPVIWTTGIEAVEVTDPCGAGATLVIHGHGFGTAAPPGVGVVAARWDHEDLAVRYGAVQVISWSDTAVTVKLGADSVSGSVAFANVAWIRAYDDAVKDRNKRVAQKMHQAGCPGYAPSAHTQIWGLWSETPPAGAANTYAAGVPHLEAELIPFGPQEMWSGDQLHLTTSQAFTLRWQTVNADTVTLRATGGATSMLAAAGQPTPATVGTDGYLPLTASSRPTVAGITLEASNAGCGTVQATLTMMITGPPLRSPALTVLQSLPGGNVDVIPFSGGELLNPGSGPSIPLVGQKRTVVRVEWWTAIRQLPIGESMTAEAELEVTGPLGVGQSSIVLRPSKTTGELQAPTKLQLTSKRPFASIAEFDQWVTAGGRPETFNFVLPPDLCVGDVALEVTLRAWNSAGRVWTSTASTVVKFHARRRIRIRYRPHDVPGQPAPTNAVCEEVLRAAAAMLPIPDPQLFRIPGEANTAGGQLIEDLRALRGGTETPQWREEIWLVIGPAGVGGYAPGQWTGATDATALTTAHEIGHLFSQNHLRLCNLANSPGEDDPALFPDSGKVRVVGWDAYGDQDVRDATDIMMRSYCPEPTWPSPERWRRVFKNLGPS
ncbi:hypothetical protein ACIBG6_31020 [Streptomyces sp. NPDC050842]|uniref:hypothetical protein n=1 Tax=Streptomyces sp. NPDC050842 TaxID=3365636 RepID=UPI0037933870